MKFVMKIIPVLANFQRKIKWKFPISLSVVTVCSVFGRSKKLAGIPCYLEKLKMLPGMQNLTKDIQTRRNTVLLYVKIE